jgi:hypothetical protein
MSFHVLNNTPYIILYRVSLAADNLPNVDIHCEHKLIDMDIENAKLNFQV